MSNTPQILLEKVKNHLAEKSPFEHLQRGIINLSDAVVLLLRDLDSL